MGRTACTEHECFYNSALYFNFAVSRRTNGRRLVTFPKTTAPSEIIELWIVKCLNFGVWGKGGGTGNGGYILRGAENILFYNFCVLSVLCLQDGAYMRAFKFIFALGPETSWMDTERDVLGQEYDIMYLKQACLENEDSCNDGKCWHVLRLHNCLNSISEASTLLVSDVICRWAPPPPLRVLCIFHWF